MDHAIALCEGLFFPNDLTITNPIEQSEDDTVMQYNLTGISILGFMYIGVEELMQPESEVRLDYV